jgi:hypothetical protein
MGRFLTQIILSLSFKTKQLQKQMLALSRLMRSSGPSSAALSREYIASHDVTSRHLEKQRK